jgi:hypothetical protein
MADLPKPLVWVKERRFSEILQDIETMPIVYASDRVRVALKVDQGEFAGERLLIRVEVNTEGKDNGH